MTHGSILRCAGRSAALSVKGHRHPAAGHIGAGRTAAALPLLRRCVLGARYADGEGRCAGHHLPGVPVPEAGAAACTGNPEPPKGFGKIKAKFAAWRAERKRKKAEEKARKKAAADAAKANKPKEPRKKAKITLEIVCTMLKGAGTLMKAVFGALRFTKIQVRLGVRGADPADAARSYGKLQAWLYPVLGVLDRFIWLQFDELRILPDFGSGQPAVEDRVSCRISAQALFIVIAAVRVLYESWRKKVLDIFL